MSCSFSGRSPSFRCSSSSSVCCMRFGTSCSRSGDLKGVEACLDLIRRWRPTKGVQSSSIQTNSCLALANICFAHPSNTQRFLGARGALLNVECMDQAMRTDTFDWNLANGASVLMCNLSFKRDDIKELYGKNGAVQAVMATISKYSGEEDVQVVRCLASMFKAIANLALFPDNVALFLDGHIEDVLSHFYFNSDRVPDWLVDLSLRTVSNLTLESTDVFMKKFGILVEPVVRMLELTDRDVPVMTLALGILANLCYCPENSEKFLSLNGLETVLKLLNQNSDPALFGPGIQLLGAQAADEKNIPALIDNGEHETRVHDPALFAGMFVFLTSFWDPHVL
eukprot:Polyplicarium_translucidae@DN442_c0_g1_i1.p1